MIETVSSGPVTVTLIADPPRVHLDRDVFLTVKTESHRHFEIRIPPIADRLTGFNLLGSFDREPVMKGDRVIRERCFRLGPALSAEYRIGPMAITVIDNSLDPPRETWFATRPILFETASLISGESVPAMQDIIGPVKLFPGARTVLSWIAGVSLLAAAAVAAWMLIRKVRRAVRLRRMSPRERALQELADLVARDLVGKNRIKDFYVELTMIVRRYIERAHKIRAPEQTTEEFLAAAVLYPRFKRETVRKLRDFLQSADLVKFAAFRPEHEAVKHALATARDYIRTDERAAEQESTDV